MSTSTSSIVFDDDGDLHPTFADFSASQIAELIYIAVSEGGCSCAEREQPRVHLDYIHRVV